MSYNGNYGQNQYNSYYEQPPKNRGGAFAAVIIIISLLLLVALVFGLFVNTLKRQTELLNATPSPLPTEAAAVPEPPDTEVQPTAKPSATPAPRTTEMPSIDGIAPEVPVLVDNPIPDIYEAVADSVVGVLNYVSEKSQSGRDVMNVYGSGTGFIVSSTGYILTNAHVVEGAEKVTVMLYNGEEVDVTVVGTDIETDVAVLHVENKVLSPIACGDSDAVRVGEYVLAIGNPLDTNELANTITFGIISAKEREITIDNYTNVYLQTDAAINFGNSGGPLLNLKGEVIGMNSAKSVTAGYDAYGNQIAAEGIGFALPINHVLDIMRQLITEGAIRRPGIGVTVSTITQTMSEIEGIPIGVRVESVVKGGPASAAGVKTGDIIVEANGTKITENADLIGIINASRIGETLEIHVYRAGDFLDLTITLAEKGAMDFNDTDEN